MEIFTDYNPRKWGDYEMLKELGMEDSDIDLLIEKMENTDKNKDLNDKNDEWQVVKRKKKNNEKMRVEKIKPKDFGASHETSRHSIRHRDFTRNFKTFD